MNARKLKFTRASVIAGLLAVLLTLITHHTIAQRQIPTEHKGVSVVNLGVLPEDSLKAQVGLQGHVMQLREITLEPGGQIARHDHASRPGLVWTLAGSWTEGRTAGNREYPDSLQQAILEDSGTEHWFWNDSTEPVRVVVCDIVPAN